MSGDERPPAAAAAEPLDELDVAVLGELHSLYGGLDPVPADLVDRVQFALALDDLDVAAGAAGPGGGAGRGGGAGPRRAPATSAPACASWAGPTPPTPTSAARPARRGAGRAPDRPGIPRAPVGRVAVTVAITGRGRW